MIGTTDIDHLNEDVVQTISDEVDVINSDRLILIRVYMSLTKLAIDKANNDVHMQFHALNMLDNLFANLMPVPSLLSHVMSIPQQPTTNNQLQR